VALLLSEANCAGTIADANMARKKPDKWRNELTAALDVSARKQAELEVLLKEQVRGPQQWIQDETNLLSVKWLLLHLIKGFKTVWGWGGMGCSRRLQHSRRNDSLTGRRGGGVISCNQQPGTLVQAPMWARYNVLVHQHENNRSHTGHTHSGGTGVAGASPWSGTERVLVKAGSCLAAIALFPSCRHILQEILRGKQEVMNQLSDCFSVITQVMSEYGMAHSAEWALVGQQMELGWSQSGGVRDAFNLPGHVVSYLRAIHDPQLAQQVRAAMACRTFKSG